MMPQQEPQPRRAARRVSDLRLVIRPPTTTLGMAPAFSCCYLFAAVVSGGHHHNAPFPVCPQFHSCSYAWTTTAARLLWLETARLRRWTRTCCQGGRSRQTGSRANRPTSMLTMPNLKQRCAPLILFPSAPMFMTISLPHNQPTALPARRRARRQTLRSTIGRAHAQTHARTHAHAQYVPQASLDA